MKNRPLSAAVTTGLALVIGCSVTAPLTACSSGRTSQGSTAIEQKKDTKLSANDIKKMATKLKLGKKDLSVAADEVKVTCGNGRVMVEQTDTTDDAAKLVDSTARRSAALARRLSGEKVAGGEVSDVTWAAVDADGNVRVAVSNDPAKAPEGGSTADVVNGSAGHVIADDVWASDGVHDQGFDQNAGDVVKPSGDKVTAGAAAKDDRAEESSESKADGSGNGDEADTSKKDATSSKADSDDKGTGSQAAASTGSGSGSGTSSGAAAASPSKPSQKKWVIDTPAWDEPVYGQVWVSNIVYTRHPRYWVVTPNGKVGPFDTTDTADSWVYNDMVNGGAGGSLLDDSYTTTEDQGHYEQQQTGTVHHDEVGHWE